MKKGKKGMKKIIFSLLIALCFLAVGSISIYASENTSQMKLYVKTNESDEQITSSMISFSPVTIVATDNGFNVDECKIIKGKEELTTEVQNYVLEETGIYKLEITDNNGSKNTFKIIVINGLNDVLFYLIVSICLITVIALPVSKKIRDKEVGL